MAIVGEAIVSASLKVLFDKLASPIITEFGSLWGIENDLAKLQTTLRMIQAVLNNAGQRQTKEEAVKIWLDELNHLAYDAEDILDEYAIHVERLKLKSDQVRRRFIPSFFNPITLKRRIAFGIREINERLADLARRKDQLGLREGFGGSSSFEIRERPQTSSLVDETCVYGRESDKKMIIELLLSDDSEPHTGNAVGVLPIVGMVGLGKTTLAQLVYNDERVHDHFDLTAWVCVSEEVDNRRITKAILESATEEVCSLMDLDPLQVKLKRTLKGRRFLLVLDDIWNENQNDWDVLRIPFMVGKQGSKIIVTTRSEIVSSIMGTVPAHHLDALANEDCWSLFKQCAFVDDTDLNSHPNLEAIGKEIVKKCKGVPLAAKTLGGHLRSKVNEDEWRYILTSEILELGNENGILLALRLSYQHLPAHLKRCFAYCSIFPKDYRFRKERLVWLWMAEGFIHSARGKQLEDIGGKYFDDLFLRSFFQYDNCDKSTFVMHDLIHDLANSISKDICFRTEFDDEIKNVPKKARHLSFLPVSYEPVKLDALYNAKSLHTFLLPDTSKDAYRHSFQQLSLSTQRWQQLHNLFLALGCLRVLCLHSFPICVLPNSIGNLKLLRFLDLSYTGIERLPKSICTLYHLQALILDGVVLHKLPKNLSNLISLRLIRMTYKGKTGHGIRKKISLQAQGLWRNRGSSPGNLKNLNYFDGNLYISSLQNMVNVIDAKDGNLEDKKNIHDLLLEWHCAGRKERAAIEEIIESLQPYVNLKGLRIQGYHSLRFPNWMAQVSNLLQVEFSNCSRTQTLPPLGELPLLKYLKIEHMDSIKHIGCEFYGGRNATIFPSLKTLIFNDMPAWEEWSCGVVNIDQEKSEDLFPCLSRLEIKICPKLKGLHFNRFPALKKLNIYLCDVLTAITKLQIPSYTGWSDGDLRKESSSSSSSLVERIEFPCLRDLSIQFCSKLRSLPPLFPSLVYLEITNCNELANLPRLPSLIRIHVNSKLICIPEEFLKPLTALEELKICSSVNLVALGNKVGGSQHLQILRHLEICGCHNLEILPQLHNLNFLIYLKIDDAPKLESFPEMGLPTNLQKFKIKRCEKMESLPEQMHSLTCLEKLSIQSCPCIMFFPQGGLPTNLRRLKISGCGEKNEEILPKCIGLHKLTSLEELTMKQCSGLMSFPRDEWLLPTSLTRLRLYNFERLECLPPSWFQQLNALVSLEINDAPRLKSLPEEGLPPTLQKLEIYHCPLLEESCRKDQGRDWHKIAHISNINIY